jgi:hypothetical protein
MVYAAKTGAVFIVILNWLRVFFTKADGIGGTLFGGAMCVRSVLMKNRS